MCSTLLFCRFNMQIQHPNGNDTLLFFFLSLFIFINISAAGAYNTRTLQTYNNLLNIINVNNQISLYKISIKPMQIQTQNTPKRNQKKKCVCLLSYSGNNTRYRRVINSHDSKTKTFQQIQQSHKYSILFTTIYHETIAHFREKNKNNTHILTTNGN